MVSAFWMVTSRCAMVITVRPFMTFSRAFCTRISLWRSKALVASSSNSILGFLMIARAMATLCFCPPLSWEPPSPTCVSYPLGSLLMTS
mmetsp:Transcript_60576/g.108044  ORF Transcript_60576/g.108044 Transcript_60576/m.108044 type:complete len:89 (-) Transcript_60576:1512-1778(-)